jgi:hypothetical protein
MRAVVGVAGVVLIVAIMWDTFEALVLPRRVTRRLRPTRLFYRTTWGLWSGLALLMAPGGRRETYLSFYGPLSLLVLLQLWAANLIVGFAMLQWGLGSHLAVAGRPARFVDDLYMSGTTFVTLGLGDVSPTSGIARLLTVVESGFGFGFLAVVIGYLPVLYQAFSRREVNITLLDARAGSPPSAGELLHRHAHDLDALGALLHEWERWSAEVLESHLSYPVLSFFRSQHDNQSWIAALTTILDASALVMTAMEHGPTRQARLTFAMARHAIVDLAQVHGTPPRAPDPDRLPPGGLAQLAADLAPAGLTLRGDRKTELALAELRALYEAYVSALAQHLVFVLPAWRRAPRPTDNWRATAWR